MDEEIKIMDTEIGEVVVDIEGVTGVEIEGTEEETEEETGIDMTLLLVMDTKRGEGAEEVNVEAVVRDFINYVKCDHKE